MSRSRRRPRALRVLVAHLDSWAGANPNIKMLYSPDTVFGDCEVHALHVRLLATRRWDIVHIYWPEWCLARDRGRLIAMLDGFRFLMLLQFARIRGARTVWSVNNVHPHESDWFLRSYMRLFARMVDQLLCPSLAVEKSVRKAYPVLGAVCSRTVVLPHYRGYYPDNGVERESARHRLSLPECADITLSIGMIRRYKNPIQLARAFREHAADHPEALLLIAGECTDPQLRREIEDECHGRPEVRVDFGYIEEENLQYYLRASDRVVMAGAESSVNSGSAMLALSFDRPVVLPRQGSFEELREVFGQQWVHTFTGKITPGDIAEIAVEPISTSVQFPERFSPDAVARATHDTFRALATGSDLAKGS